MAYDRDAWKHGIPEDALVSRVNLRGCNWDYTEDCETGLSALKAIDQGAWDMMMARIRRSHRSGLKLSDNGDTYRAPVGNLVNPKKFKRRAMPWLGELKVDERTPKKRSKPGRAAEYRLYFGEPLHDNLLVVGVSVGIKHGSDGDAVKKQTDAMEDAMWKIIFWCEDPGRAVIWREHHRSC
ncbi:hypothetical protein CJ179_50315 [Rhodococcus sp. ACS1]|uniref:hypothetical protein n=1 Tax=Rhodococcus sp. ACS1 TaxID=2028570 RepID=UPI000BB0DF6D|nr:hypothetical protein [Rhodococcus sp. ACS1]PBC35019.1 hypothetical protein CJ179_50315 [Rhodococcus sp. ACS1]